MTETPFPTTRLGIDSPSQAERRALRDLGDLLKIEVGEVEDAIERLSLSSSWPRVRDLVEARRLIHEADIEHAIKHPAKVRLSKHHRDFVLAGSRPRRSKA